MVSNMKETVGSPRMTRISANGADLNVAIAGDGPTLVLLHGWPHTWQVWSAVIPQLAASHTVIAPDLRGLGASSAPDDRYDAAAIAADVTGLLDALDVPAAALMALDASVPAAFLTAMQHPGRVTRLVVMESLLPPLPGAEDFLAAGPPWWFGFHSVPGLAETVLAGHESEYIDWFLTTGTFTSDGIDLAVRRAFIDAYTGHDALRRGFGYYRAAATNTGLVADAAAGSRLTCPAMALGGSSVGDALHQQLRGVADHLTGHVIPHCGHIIPLDQPQAMLDLVTPFLASEAADQAVSA